MSYTTPSRLTDNELIAEVKRLAHSNRETMVRLIAHLVELDSRRLFLAAGYGSLYEYCRQALRLSEHAAYHVIKAIRPARRFPLVLDKLLDGSMNLTTVRLIGPLLKRSNHEELLAEASGKSKREVEKIVARLNPKPDVPTTVRRLPDPAPIRAPPVAPMRGALMPLPAAPPGVPPAAAPAPRAVNKPLSPGRYNVQFTATERTQDLLDMAKDMLSHAVRPDDLDEIFHRALLLLAKALARKKFAATPRPRDGRGAAPGSRYIRARVKREVWVRDAGRCRFGGKEGRRCTERRYIQFHHCEKPYAAGGEATVENLQLRCGAHNRYEAEQYYGRSWQGVDVVREASASYRVFLPTTGPGASCQPSSPT